MGDLEGLFGELDSMTRSNARSNIIRAPFGYPGGKTKSAHIIIEHLPHSKIYVEPFGGSGAVLLAKSPTKLEVLNDRYMGIVCFYRCLQDKNKLDRLCERLKLTVHAREEFYWCQETWQDPEDEVERAARWYYMIIFSFGTRGIVFGRATSTKSISDKLISRIPRLHEVHERMQNVQVENQDWYQCVLDYDSSDTVFYMDPPYIDAFDVYHKELSQDEYYKLTKTIFQLKGFVALSGYPNPIFDNLDWDRKFTWEQNINIKLRKDHHSKTDKAQECLWIKEFSY